MTRLKIPDRGLIRGSFNLGDGAWPEIRMSFHQKTTALKIRMKPTPLYFQKRFLNTQMVVDKSALK